MKINFVLSDTTKGATSSAIKTICENAEKNFYENNIVIVPETKSIIIEKEILSLSKTGVFFNVFVYSFVRLLDRLGNVPYDKILSKQTLVILLRKIIIDNYKRLTCYKKTAKTVGFAEKIYDTIAQFKSSGVTVDDLKLSLATKSEALKEKLTDIIMLYDEYEKVLAGKFYDDCDRLALTSKFAKESEFLRSSNIYVIGFDNITFEMQAVLRDLAINCKEITFSCVYFNDKKTNAHIQQNELYKKFKHIADSLKYPYIPRFFYSKKIGDFKVLKEQLYSTENRKFEPNGNVQIFKAKSEKIEIDFVANTILKGVKEGKRFRDFGVFATSLEEKETLIKDCFDAYKIPYFINSPKKIDDHFFVKFITNAFEMYLTHLQTEKVLTFVSNPLFNALNFEIFESYVYEMGTNYNDFLEEINENYIQKYLKKLKSHKFSAEDEAEENSRELELLNGEKNLKELKQTFASFKAFYNSFYEQMKSSKTAEDFCNVISEMINYFSAENMLENLAEIQSQNCLVVESEITRTIFNKTNNFIKQIKNFLADTEMSASEFLMIFNSGFSSTKINISPVSIDCVIVQDNTDGFYNIKDMFIIGAIEGKFPGKIQDSGIILDLELEESKKQIGKAIEPTVKDINKREKFRIYEALLEPTENLYISYSEKQVSGKINTRAQVVTTILNLFDKKIESSTYEKLEFVNFEIFENRFAKLINKFQNDKASKSDLNLARSILSDNISKGLQMQLNKLATSSKKFEVFGVNELYFYNDKTSVSQMQTYFDCPYKFFVKYGLKLKENKLSKISTMDIGTIIHRVVELFVKDLKKYKDLSDEKLDEEVSKLLNFAIEENGYNAEKNASLINFVYKECERLCRYLIYEQSISSFKFDKAEYSFENENAIRLNSKNRGNLVLAGKIDRIDRFQDYIRIIDYKTGTISNNLSSIFYGTKIQLASYLEAVSNITNSNVAGIFYFPIHSNFAKDDGEGKELYRMSGFLLDDVEIAKFMDAEISPEHLRSDVAPFQVKFDKKTGEMSFNKQSTTTNYSAKDFENIKAYVNEICSNAADEILDGFIEPSPIASTSSDIPQSCAYCPVAGFCGLSNAKFKNGRKYPDSVEIYSFEKCDKDELSENIKESNVDDNREGGDCNE